jgi:hypothetical protein
MRSRCHGWPGAAPWRSSDGVRSYASEPGGRWSCSASSQRAAPLLRYLPLRLVETVVAHDRSDCVGRTAGDSRRARRPRRRRPAVVGHRAAHPVRSRPDRGAPGVVAGPQPSSAGAHGAGRPDELVAARRGGGPAGVCPPSRRNAAPGRGHPRSISPPEPSRANPKGVARSIPGVTSRAGPPRPYSTQRSSHVQRALRQTP